MTDELLDKLIALDIDANVRLGGRRETVSARLGRRLVEGKATPRELALCQVLELLEPDHCKKAYARTLDRPRPHRHAADDRSLEADIYAVLGVR